MNKLPTVLSEAIEVALNDMEACRKDDKYIIDFENWHSPTKTQFGENGTTCSVCFAGSVMAKSMGAKHGKETTPSDFGDDSMMLVALDSIREGRINSALSVLRIQGYTINNVNVNEHNYESFVKSMNDIIKLLKEKGL